MNRTVAIVSSMLTLVAVCAAPADAAKTYTMYGTFPMSSPSDPLFGHFTQPNPEGNWNKACARGVNGTDSRVKVGARVSVINGNDTQIGKGRITGARWEEDHGAVGQCVYEFVVKGLPRANFYCPLVLGEALSAAGLSEADRNGAIAYEEYVGYFGPNWPANPDAYLTPSEASYDRSHCSTD